jgi:hypothetical protein
MLAFRILRKISDPRNRRTISLQIGVFRSSFVFLRLEHELQRELDLPGSGNGSGDLLLFHHGLGEIPACVKNAGRWGAEVRMIQNVEEFRAELESGLLIAVFFCNEKSTLNNPGPVSVFLPRFP